MEIEIAEKNRRQACSSCCYKEYENIIDTNNFIKYIMDPFEKYEPWIDPDKKLIGLDKIHNIVEDYKSKHNNKKKQKNK